MSNDFVPGVSPVPDPVSPQGPIATPPSSYYPTPLSPSDERTWAMLAHLSILLNLVTGLLGVGAAFVIYLVYRDRSRYVAFQSLQSILFQLIFWVGGGTIIGLVWAITGTLSMIIIGLALIPFAIALTLLFALAPVLSLIYGILGAIETSQGNDFRYWLIGNWVASRMH